MTQAGQMAASDYVPIFFKNRLHLAGPQMSTRRSHSDVAVVTKFIKDIVPAKDAII